MDTASAAAGMRVVVTGGCGFLGQHLTAALRELDPACEVVLLDLVSHPRPTHDFDADPQVIRRTDRDICMPGALSMDLEGADVVVHMAGIISFARRERGRLYRINVGGTRNVIDAAIRAGVPRFVQVSSVAALGYGEDDAGPIDESFVFDWRKATRNEKHYMLSKKAADDVVRERSGEIDATIVYPGLMLGPGDRTTAIKFVAPIASGKARLMTPGGTNIVDVRDVARGLAAVVLRKPPRREYLLSGVNVEFQALARAIAGILGKRSPDIIVPSGLERPIYHVVRASEALSRRAPVLTADGVHSAFRKRYYSNARARADLGWEPAIPFETTIRDTVRWLIEDEGGSVGSGNGRQ